MRIHLKHLFLSARSYEKRRDRRPSPLARISGRGAGGEGANAAALTRRCAPPSPADAGEGLKNRKARAPRLRGLGRLAGGIPP
jgi:hypothetical protein